MASHTHKNNYSRFENLYLFCNRSKTQIKPTKFPKSSTSTSEFTIIPYSQLVKVNRKQLKETLWKLIHTIVNCRNIKIDDTLIGFNVNTMRNLSQSSKCR